MNARLSWLTHYRIVDAVLWFVVTYSLHLSFYLFQAVIFSKVWSRVLCWNIVFFRVLMLSSVDSLHHLTATNQRRQYELAINRQKKRSRLLRYYYCWQAVSRRFVCDKRPLSKSFRSPGVQVVISITTAMIMRPMLLLKMTFRVLYDCKHLTLAAT